MMRFVVERDAFVGALSFVTKYVDNASKIPILADVMISVGEDGRGSIVATSLEQAASDTFGANVEAAGSACLPAALLLKAVKASIGAEVKIDVGERQAVVTVGKSRFTLPILPSADFPLPSMLIDEGDAKFSMSAEALRKIKKSVEYAREPDGGRYFLIGVSWRLRDGKVEFCATDGAKLSLSSEDAASGAASLPDMIVPGFDMPAWTGDVGVVATDKFIRLTNGDQVVASKLVDATYPDYRLIIPDNPTRLLFDREELLGAITRASITADSREHSVLLVGRDGRMSVHSQSAVGEVMDEVTYEGDDFQIALVSTVLVPVLSSFDCEMVELGYRDHNSAITIHDRTDPSRLAMAMPYRDPRVAEFITSKVSEAA